MKVERWAFLTLALGMLALPAESAGQDEFADVKIEVVPIKDGLYMLVGRGGNIGLSTGTDGTFLVDDQFAPLTDRIEAAIRSVTGEGVRFLVNTHFHGDHTGGNENFGKRGTLIVAHENVRRRMSVDQFREILRNDRTPAAPPDALPRITFTDTVTFYWNGEEIRIVHIDHAHTDGDSLIYFVNAGVFHMGDIFFNRHYPFIDVDSGGNVNGMIAAAERVLSLATSDTKIIPGHGALADPDDLRAYRDMLIAVRDKVQTMVNDGRSVDEIVASKPTASFDDPWEGNIDRFVRGVYYSLRRAETE